MRGTRSTSSSARPTTGSGDAAAYRRKRIVLTYEEYVE